MPESVTDRCVKSHESVFLFAKNQQYYFDYKAIQEPVAQSTIERAKRGVSENNKYVDGAPGQTAQSINKPRSALSLKIPQKRNRRSVWSIPNQPLKEGIMHPFPCIGGTLHPRRMSAGGTVLIRLWDRVLRHDRQIA